MPQKLEQSDFEDLSAHLDGRLDSARSADVEDLIQSDSAWGAAWRELQALDRVLDVYDIPSPPSGLADRVLESVRTRARRRRALRWVWPAAGAAAAAAVIVVAMLLSSARPDPNAPPVVKKTPDVELSPQGVDQAIIESLDFVRDMDVLENFETLEAIERIEVASRGS